MIGLWMLYALLIGTAVAAAARALEPVAAVVRARRLVYAAAIAIAVLWPVLALFVAHQTPAARGGITVLRAFEVEANSSAGALTFVGWSRAHADRVLIVLWAGASLLLIARVAAALRQLGAQRADWEHREIDGTPVRVARELGPAVVGLANPEIVLPAWAVALDEPLRALVLRHEREHRAWRDPQLLFAAAVLVALFPWNLALRWCVRRLKLAMEMDCDARVLDAYPDVERYGLLVLTIAQYRTTRMVGFAPMLPESTTQLERRVLAMRTHTARISRFAVLGATIAAAGVVAAACAVEPPANGHSITAPTGAAPKNLAPRSGGAYYDSQVNRPVRPAPGNRGPRYPDDMRAAQIEGEVIAEFVVGTDGRVEMGTFKELRSTNEEFTTTVRTALADMQFEPAEVGGAAVRQVVQMPFQFNLTRGQPAAKVSGDRPGVKPQ